MNRKETLQIMAVIHSEYPDFCKGFSDDDLERKASLWEEMFADDDARLVAAAVKSIIVADQREFAPKVSHIKEAMRQLTSAGDLDEDQAWERIRLAASRSGYEAHGEYDKLPWPLREMCSPGQLYEWSQMDSDVFNSVIGSHFRRAYRSRQQSRKRDALLPPDVKQMLSGLSDRMALEDGAHRGMARLEGEVFG